MIARSLEILWRPSNELIVELADQAGMELVKATQADYKEWSVVIVPPSSTAQHRLYFSAGVAEGHGITVSGPREEGCEILWHPFLRADRPSKDASSLSRHSFLV